MKTKYTCASSLPLYSRLNSKIRNCSFGGTDGAFHYNDTWCFDMQTRIWTELTCIGFIPVPREGHSAALVGDVMYVFGGRGVDGKDLGDLGSFKISSKWLVILLNWVLMNVDHRWYMFQNMGPQPSGRSGHAMATADGRMFVIGGESGEAGPTKEDAMLIHVLDTSECCFLFWWSRVGVGRVWRCLRV